MRHGQGTFVAAQVNKRQAAAHRDRLVDELRQVARQAVGLGLNADEIHELLAEAIDGITPRIAVATKGESTT
jgi:DNA-binding transcriptional regulator YhcF (GntR family)